MKTNFEFSSKLIVRTPTMTEQQSAVDLIKLLADPTFLESVYIASPALYNECLKLKQGNILSDKEAAKVKKSLTKYAYRMGTRCTPFGLFSGCHVSNWTKDKSGITISDAVKRHTRLDMHYLCTLAQNLAQRTDIRAGIRFFANNSTYIIGNEIRYVEYTYQKENRLYQICSVAHNEYIEKILSEAKEGVFLNQLVVSLMSVDEEMSRMEVEDFINELIGSQILISEMEPSTTEKDFLLKIISLLEKVTEKSTELKAIINTLSQIDETLKKIDSNKFQQTEGYQAIVALVKELGVPFDEAKLFHTDIYKTEVSGGVYEGYQDQLISAISVLNKITAYNDNPNLKNFKDNFYKRYEEKEMPLSVVLDTETGIGYLNSASNQDITPLIDDIFVPSQRKNTSSINWNQLEQLLHRKNRDRTGKDIEILDEDLADFEENWNNLTPSFPLMFKFFSDDELFIESCGGSSAVNLLGRFANGNPEINEIVQEIADKEQDLEKDVVFAEIIHLPESRVSNILLHPPFRKYEIPYLSNANSDAENTIDISDLCVSVKNNRIILRSKKLNKIVIPRLSNAHNFSHNALPVYQFLCDLQNQGKRGGLYFHWGGLSKIQQHFPRVKYRNCILSLAQWNIHHSDVKSILDASNMIRRSKIDEFLQKWDLPRYVVLAEGDNELFIDFENDMLVNIWLEYIKKRSVTVLKEFIHSSYGVANSSSKVPYSNQVIALIQSNRSSFKNSSLAPNNLSSVKRIFTLGSEWIYFKIYCGVRSADRILAEAIKPACSMLEEEKKISKWFFIRYNDPDFHLRVRFHVSDIAHIGHVIQTFNEFTSAFMENGIIWKIQNDTYNREIERYGSNTIENVESLFHQDSIAVVKMIAAVQHDERDNFRWMWAIKSVDELLRSFEISMEHRYDLMESLRNAFAQEFNATKLLKTQLDTKYRKFRGGLEKWLANESLLLEDPDELAAIRYLFDRTVAGIPVVQQISYMNQRQELEMSLVNLLGSLIHMTINRVITSQPRFHELIIYDFMSRLYKSSIAISKYANKKNDAAKISSL